MDVATGLDDTMFGFSRHRALDTLHVATTSMLLLATAASGAFFVANAVNVVTHIAGEQRKLKEAEGAAKDEGQQ